MTYEKYIKTKETITVRILTGVQVEVICVGVRIVLWGDSG